MKNKWLRRMGMLSLGILIMISIFIIANQQQKKQHQTNSKEAINMTKETPNQARQEQTTQEQTTQEQTTQEQTTQEQTTQTREIAILNPTLLPKEAKNVSIVVNKKEHILYLYNDMDIIAKYKVALSKNPIGKKTQMGDKKVPEGEYYICTKNDKSKFYLSFGLSYPNIDDAKVGYENGLITKAEYDSIVSANEAKKGPNWYTNLGGEIMIHGGEKGSSYDWTTGCVAVDNAVMDILWQYCNVGTKVTINP